MAVYAESVERCCVGRPRWSDWTRVLVLAAGYPVRPRRRSRLDQHHLLD